jgi:hypothetical protein
MILSDIQIDLNTGEPVIDTETGDAALLYGEDVVLQDNAIRLRTQRGQIKRQGLDDFGLGYMDFIKTDLGPGAIEKIASRMSEEAKQDDRIQDANTEFMGRIDSEEVIFKVMIKLKSGAIRPLIIPIPG